jgi:hypothetical protein
VEVREASRHLESDSRQGMDHGLYDEASYSLCLSSRDSCQKESSVSPSGPEGMPVPGGKKAVDAVGGLQANHSTPAKSFDSLDVEAQSGKHMATWTVERAHSCGGCPWNGGSTV